MFVEKLKKVLEGKNCEGHAEDWEETDCITEELRSEFYKLNFNNVAQIDTDRRRWYDIATVVFENQNEIFGVRGVVRINGEQQAIWVCYVDYKVFSMEKEEIVTYKYTKIEEEKSE